MRQSNIIFATIVFAFVIYITMRGQLGEYISLFTGAPTKSNATPSAAPDGLAPSLNQAVRNGAAKASAIDWSNAKFNPSSIIFNKGGI